MIRAVRLLSRTALLLSAWGLLPGGVAPSYSQTSISWDLLGRVEVKYEQDLARNVWWMVANFEEELRAMDGQRIRIRGYLIPTSVSGNMVVVSAFPMASCFFCGGAGPESMIEVFPSQKLRFSTDDFVELEGILHLVERSEGGLYRLTQARISD